MEYGGHQVRGTKTLRNLATDPGSSIWNLDDTAVPSQNRLRRPFFLGSSHLKHGDTWSFIQKNIDIAREERSTKKVAWEFLSFFYLQEIFGYNQRIKV